MVDFLKFRAGAPPMRRLQSRQPIGGEKEGCTFGRIDHATSLTIPSCSLLQFSCSPPPCNRGHPKQLWAASCTAWSLMQSGMEALKGNLSCYPSFGLVPNWNKQLFGHEKCIKYCENCQIMKKWFAVVMYRAGMGESTERKMSWRHAMQRNERAADSSSSREHNLHISIN